MDQEISDAFASEVL